MTQYIDAGSSGEWGWHATEVALRCPRLFAYSYRMPHSTEADERAPLLKGSLVHQGLGHHYKRRQIVAEGGHADEWAHPDDAIEYLAAKLGRHAKQYVDGVQRTVAQYAAHYAHERLDVLYVEEVFTAEIGGYPFTQRFDLVVREPDGKVWIYDHKSTGRLGPAVAERYTLSGQFLGMASFGRALWGDEFGGVKLNLLQLADEKKMAAFSRQLPDPAPAALKQFPLTVLHARKRIAGLDQSGIEPKDWPMVLSEQVCLTSYGHCEFFDRCRFG